MLQPTSERRKLTLELDHAWNFHFLFCPPQKCNAGQSPANPGEYVSLYQAGLKEFAAMIPGTLPADYLDGDDTVDDATPVNNDIHHLGADSVEYLDARGCNPSWESLDTTSQQGQITKSTA